MIKKFYLEDMMKRGIRIIIIMAVSTLFLCAGCAGQED